MTTCRKCQLEIIWKKMNDKWTCMNPDGSSHWDLCRATRTRLAQTEGKAFSDKHGEGFEHQGKRHYMMRKGLHVIGTDYSLPSCDCKSPPWEDCIHTTVEDSYLSHLKSI